MKVINVSEIIRMVNFVIYTPYHNINIFKEHFIDY